MVEWVFWVFALALVGSSLGVVFSSRPVLSVLLLIKCFVCASVLWMLLGAEFLSLALIFVYVGAVMTLFLFVVMMLNQVSIKAAKRRWLFGGVSAVLCIGLLIGLYVYLPEGGFMMKAALNASESNTDQIAAVLYTDHLLAFEWVAMILLVAMVAAIALTFKGTARGTKAQKASAQMAVSAKDRLRLVDGK